MNLINEENLDKILKRRNVEHLKNDIMNDIESMINKTLNDKITNYRKAERNRKIDEQKERTPFLDIYPDYDISTLPSWINNNIEKAQLVGKSHKVVENNGKKYHLNNAINHLSGKEWIYFLRSVTNTRYATSGENSYAHNIRKVHPSPKPPELMKDIISFFSKENDWVLDYFMGVGGTLLGASLCDRNAVGIDLSSDYIDTYKQANKELKLKEQITIQGDSLDILENHKDVIEDKVQDNLSLILIDPPYADMMKKANNPYSDKEEDLGNMDRDKFLRTLTNSIKQSSTMLKDKGHIIVFIKDMQPKGKELNLLHADIIHHLNEINNVFYMGTKIWVDETINLHPYGYPYIYTPNQLHQYILVFQKKD